MNILTDFLKGSILREVYQLFGKDPKIVPNEVEFSIKKN